ncbi:S1 family peptidase [Exiguobacterium sp. SH1S21]|uniref:S1 family peptidase n=1 Tax=Exiguobacterium sp. SH1S21 TaxID=2510953 RepID=UPI001375F18B|nr:serine protease [Exiguobacterium sp. SH1S21]
MTCPRCGTKTRSKTTACPTCGHRPRRLKWIAIPTVIALIAFISILTVAYLKEAPRSTDSLADKVNLNISEDTVSADNASMIDLTTLEKSLFSVGAGTGFLISPQDILTAAHNVEGLTTITIDHDGKKIKGTVVGRTVDVAVIRINQMKETPFMFSHAIAAADETLITLMPSKRIEGQMTFNETGYEREFDIPRRAIGSPIVASDGRVLAMHLKSKALPVALFEQDVLAFLESDTPAPPLAKLAPVAPITPPRNEQPVTPTAPTPQPETEAPAPEAAPEPTAPAEEPIEAAPATPEETPEPEVVEPEVPAEEPETPPVTEEPAEPEPPVTEPEEPVTPEKPAAEAEKPVKKQENKPKDQPQEKPVTEEKPVKKDQPAEQEKHVEKEQPAKQENAVKKEQPAKQENPAKQEQPTKQEKPAKEEKAKPATTERDEESTPSD